MAGGHLTLNRGSVSRNKQWISDITGRLTIPALVQYLRLWRVVEAEGVQLIVGTEDIVSWRWSPCGTYTARSAYKMFFKGATRFAGSQAMWKAWAPLKVKFFTWLAARKRIWTADRQHRHRLQDQSVCPLCDQELETADHLFVHCNFTKQVWHAVLTTLGVNPLMPVAEMELMDWWTDLRRGHNKFKKKGIDSAVMLVTWCIWKERNGRTFGSRPTNDVNQMFDIVMKEGQLWVMAGAKWLAALGWPEMARVV